MKVGILNTRNPEYDNDWLSQLYALYHGGRSWEGMKSAFLPMNYKEHRGFYKDRLARATYTPHASFIVDLIAAWLFEEEPRFTGASSAFDDLADDADRTGTPLTSFIQDVFVDALVAKCAYVWVNLPSRDPSFDPVSLAEEEAAGVLSPYLVRIDPRSVLDWGEDERGALTWILVHDKTSYRRDAVSERVTKHRWTMIDSTTIRRWEWFDESGEREDPHDEDTATEQPRMAP